MLYNEPVTKELLNTIEERIKQFKENDNTIDIDYFNACVVLKLDDKEKVLRENIFYKIKDVYKNSDLFNYISLSDFIIHSYYNSIYR